jgi:hypothetical protein
VAKSKKVRRSSIRHMAADDAFTVLEALERAEQQEQPVAPDGSTTDDESASDDDVPEGAPA